MKNKINEWLFKMAIKITAIRLVRSFKRLTPEYLLQKGFVENNGEYSEPNIKDRDKITVTFENHYYRVWHSEKKTFIALESSIEWFEMYYLIIHPDNGRYKLAGI